ncbi:MAG TPA: hypothetical protein VF858_10185 [Gemmatimonadaceae bacterium]
MILFEIRVVASLHGGDRKNVIEEWLDDLREQKEVVANELRVRLSYLRELPRDQWEIPFFRASMQGFREIGELRFKCFGTQFRVFGFFGPNDGEFTLLGGATHKMNRYNPASAIESADKLRKQVLDGERKTEKFTVIVAPEVAGQDGS